MIFAMLAPADIIRIKRDGGELDATAIASFVDAVARDKISEAQIGAFLMAVYQRGLTSAEQALLTLAMRDSGEVLDWEALNGPVLDKHSTGGVGDLVSLVLGPLMAACGVYVPMISGRGLGHTGGTLDKLESIPGFNVHLDLDAMHRVVAEVGFAMVGQGPDLAPADRRMYAVRDVTATVSSIPLIVSSILSKKLAEGLDGLVLDVKTGNGAFMQDHTSSRQLAETITQVASVAGLSCKALITDMNQPLAWTAGNALEMREAIAFMNGGARHPRVETVVLALGAEMLVMGGIADSPEAAEDCMRDRLDSGAAVERFARMVALQGGPSDLIENMDQYLQGAPVVRPLQADEDGHIAGIDTWEVGHCVKELGGGRNKVGDTIDSRVGLSELLSVGDEVSRSQVLAVIHAATDQDWQQAAASLSQSIRLEAGTGDPLPVIYGSS